jgi:hypothetical protein
LGDQIKKNEIGGARSTFWERRGTVHTVFWWANQRERDHLKDTGVDEWIILNWTFRKCDGAMDWIDLAHNSDGWRAVVNVVLNLWVPIMRGIYCLS